MSKRQVPQHRKNQAPRYMSYIHASNEADKRLGLFWKRLIAQEFVTEEDALLLAENFFQGSGGYSDDMAKDMLRKILSRVADRYRPDTKVSTDNIKTAGA